MADQQNIVFDWIVRLKVPIFILILIMNAAAFNGEWRVGGDSALYRGVARSLASGEGYRFRGERNDHIYPGLPLMLAGVEKLFPSSDPLRPAAALICVHLMGLATLLIVYRLISIHYPGWIAVAVTSGVAINRHFLQYSCELMTDVPFLFGICLALWGFEKVQHEHRIRGVLLMVIGLCLAASMRPTFWALALAWVAACGWGIARGPKRARFAIALIVLLGLGAAWLTLNAATRGVSPLDGRYERQAIGKLTELTQANWPNRAGKMFEDHIPDAFFGLEIAPVVNTLLGLVILGSAICLVVRHPLWGLYALTSAVMTLLLGSSPRYFLMILPLMLLGWALVVQSVSRSVAGWRFGPEAVVLVGLGLVTVPSLVRSLDIVREQRGLTPEGVKPFLEVFKKGKMLKYVQMSAVIQRRVPPRQAVLGPEPRLMSFLSDRRVYLLYDRIRKRPHDPVPAVKRLGFRFLILPRREYRMENDHLAYRLTRSGIISFQEGARTWEAGGLELGKISISRSNSKEKVLKRLEQEKKQRQKERAKERARKQRKREIRRNRTTPATAPIAAMEHDLWSYDQEYH